MLPPALQADLVLASSSPRRAAILAMLGFEFETVLAPIDEDATAPVAPSALAEQLARRKAEAVAQDRRRGVVIGADTIVVVDADVLNKPKSVAEALAMQRRLRGRWHTVFTGVAIVDAASQRSATGSERTEVLFHDWDDEFLQRYVDTGEGLDKAGAYAIQGFGALLVREIRGCFYNVMGLPIGTFVRLLRQVHGAGS